jgi:hypothetical protein
MIEVQCPVTGEQTHWPDRQAHIVQPLLALSRNFEIAIEDLWIMIKVERELGPEWVPDSLEWWDLTVAITNDHEMLRLARQGEITLSIFELLAIRARARRSIELHLEHERDPRRRARLQALLRPSAVWRENQKLAREMLAKQKAN